MLKITIEIHDTPNEHRCSTLSIQCDSRGEATRYHSFRPLPNDEPEMIFAHAMIVTRKEMKKFLGVE